MKTLKLKAITLIAITGLLSSCSNDDNNPISPTPTTETVYVVGSTIGGMTKETKLWKDGVESNIGSVVPADMAVKPDGKVYVFGTSYDTNGNGNASLIIDGTATAFATGTSATHLFLSGNDEYLLYDHYYSNGVQTKLKKNSVVSTVTNTGRAGGLFVSDNTSYIAYNKTGTNGNYDAIVLKKGTQEVPITNGTVFGDYASQVAVSGNDIYILGSTMSGKRKITVWKTTKQSSSVQATNITDGTNNAYGRNIFIKGSDVYIVGNEQINGILIATVWKNGTPTRLANTNSNATDVFVSSNNNVYVAGVKDQKATLWKNGTATQLSNVSSVANCIYVTEN